AIIAAKGFASRRHHAGKGSTMSKDTPEPRHNLVTKVQRARLHIAATGVPQTLLLFAVYDQEWTAWYTFTEASVRIADAEAWERAHPSKNHKSRVYDFGHRTLHLSYRRTIAMRVDDFAEGSGSRADLVTKVLEHRRWGNFRMMLTVRLSS